MKKKLLALLLIIVCWAGSAGATIYYVDANITDTYPASATPDFTTYNPVTFETTGGSASVYKTMADINAGSFSAGDQVLWRRGQEWRERLLVPSGGASGNPVVYGAYGSGAKPIFNPCQLLNSGWSVYSGNVWQVTTQAPDSAPLMIWFNDTVRGTARGSAGACVADYDWYWSGNTLYVYSSGGNPASFYTSVEMPLKQYCIRADWNAGKAHVTIQDLDLKHANLKIISQAEGNANQTSNQNWEILRCDIHHNAPKDQNDAHGVDNRCHNTWVRWCKIWEVGANGVQLSADNCGAEYNEVYDCWHHQLDTKGNFGGASNQNPIFRYNYVYNTPGYTGDTNGIYAGTLNAAATNAQIYYNIVRNIKGATGGRGIQVQGSATASIYNNVVYMPELYCIYLENGAVTVKNNISVNTGENNHRLLKISNNSSKALDYNIWRWTGASPTWADIVSTSYTTWSAFRTDYPAWEVHGKTDDPGFENRSGNFNQAIDFFRLVFNDGTDVSLTQDYAGNPVPK